MERLREANTVPEHIDYRHTPNHRCNRGTIKILKLRGAELGAKLHGKGLQCRFEAPISQVITDWG